MRAVYVRLAFLSAVVALIALADYARALPKAYPFAAAALQARR
jgi:hypothetical protein